MQPYVKITYSVLGAVLLLVGCLIPCPSKPSCDSGKLGPKSPRQGVYHLVQKGQTLWKIAEVYGVPIGKLLECNHLKRSDQIRTGQRLWIPKVRQVLSVPATCPPQSPPPFFSWPLHGKIIRYFGPNGLLQHGGIDIQAPFGSLIKSAASGEVVYANSEVKGYGKVIVIKHQGGYSTVYANNQENLVKVKNKVLTGEVIGKVGRSESDGVSHLHFEIRYRKEALDPISYLP